MQRLTTQREDERGAVAVVVALLMVPLLAFTAIAIDVASAWSKQQRLQVAADAAALAIAQDCSRHTCGSWQDAARSMTDSNFGAGAEVPDVMLDATRGTVTVDTSAKNQNFFAPVLGTDYSQNTVTATASAAWGAPTGGTAAMPLAFSYCEWTKQTEGGIPSQTEIRTIYTTKDSKTTCTGPSNLVVPGGFGWLTPNDGPCAVDSSLSDQLTSDPGASGPGTCSTQFTSYLGKIILLPIFDAAGGTGSGAWYRVYGYAAFRIVGYQFPSLGAAGDTGGCQKCIRGYFTQFVELDDAFEYSADPSVPHLGMMIVELTG